jgi:HEAT repeat protein
VIWQHRQQSVIPLLGEALLDAHPRIWRQALDGLVALSSPAAVAALRSARVHRHDVEFRRWVDEAIVQADAEGRTS